MPGEKAKVLVIPEREKPYYIRVPSREFLPSIAKRIHLNAFVEMYRHNDGIAAFWDQEPFIHMMGDNFLATNLLSRLWGEQVVMLRGNIVVARYREDREGFYLTDAPANAETFLNRMGVAHIEERGNGDR